MDVATTDISGQLSAMLSRQHGREMVDDGEFMTVERRAGAGDGGAADVTTRVCTVAVIDALTCDLALCHASEQSQIPVKDVPVTSSAKPPGLRPARRLLPPASTPSQTAHVLLSIAHA